MSQNDIVARLDRLESLDAIRQLAANYSLALDMRDIDALVNLFAEDIRIGKDKVGRAHFKKWMDETLRIQFTGTAHNIGNHIIEFEENIYDMDISFELIEFIRDEKKFGSIDDLTAQIQLDVDKIKNNF